MKETEILTEIGFLFDTESAFYSNFSITALGFLIFLLISAGLSRCSGS